MVALVPGITRSRLLLSALAIALSLAASTVDANETRASATRNPRP